MLLSNAYSQGPFSFPCFASGEVPKKLGGGTARTADPDCPKGYSMPWYHAQYISWGGFGQGAAVAAWRQAGHWLLGGEQLPCASLIFSVIIIIVNFSFIVLLNCLYLNPWVSFFSDSSPHPTRRGREESKRLCGPGCWLAIHHERYCYKVIQSPRKQFILFSFVGIQCFVQNLYVFHALNLTTPIFKYILLSNV